MTYIDIVATSHDRFSEFAYYTLVVIVVDVAVC